jgi:hypothetical protein
MVVRSAPHFLKPQIPFLEEMVFERHIVVCAALNILEKIVFEVPEKFCPTKYMIFIKFKKFDF